MGRLIILVILFSINFTLSAQELKDQSLKSFETDGCTLFIDGPPGRPNLWRHCCVEHDLRYWIGGNLSDRNNADLRLRSCVEAASSKTWSDIIYWGVKTGQRSPIKFNFRWNWGWSTPREVIALNDEEIKIAIEELRRLPMDQAFIEKFIELNFPNSIE